MTIHRLMVLLTLAVSVPASAALAQDAFPAPSPNQGGAEAQACISGFAQLREDAETKGKMIKLAGARHASPEEVCKIIGDYSMAEIKMIKYVEANSTKCGISLGIAEQLRTNHRTTEALLERICKGADEQKRWPGGRPFKVSLP